ncbi:hypothetical protein DERP_008999 [Dermatophagoides pteronyssinus]|uniref:Uncharacterized protein n=1 Tax=Dermatophagoides pteronyssinus TaxID=6956 RepID=A0ABQ8JG53_DERPT|nr:hypothetical protein DERP_008999 [Dermatophagoides pteronyssinus]
MNGKFFYSPNNNNNIKRQRKTDNIESKKKLTNINNVQALKCKLINKLLNESNIGSNIIFRISHENLNQIN